jgi:hypothetical protein
VSKGSVASGRSERVGVSACGRIGVMSGSRLGCERLSGLVLIMGLQRMGPMGLMRLMGTLATPQRQYAHAPSGEFHDRIAG